MVYEVTRVAWTRAEEGQEELHALAVCPCAGAAPSGSALVLSAFATQRTADRVDSERWCGQRHFVRIQNTSGPSQIWVACKVFPKRCRCWPRLQLWIFIVGTSSAACLCLPQFEYFLGRTCRVVWGLPNKMFQKYRWICTELLHYTITVFMTTGQSIH